jgi:hypothetical protein
MLEKIGNCIFDAELYKQSHGFECLDAIGQVAFVNHIHYTGKNRVTESESKIAEWIKEIQIKYNDSSFRIYKQVEADEITIRMHMVRPGVANWMEDGIEINWAIQAMLNGIDSPSLTILAGLGEHNSDIITYFLRTSSELDIGFQNEYDAAKYLIGCCLIDTIQGLIKPIDTCQKITEDVYFHLRNSGFLHEKNLGEKFGIGNFIVNHYDYVSIEHGECWVDSSNRTIPFEKCIKELDDDRLCVAKDWLLRNNKK